MNGYFKRAWRLLFYLGGPKRQGRQPAMVLEAIEVDELFISYGN